MNSQESCFEKNTHAHRVKMQRILFSNKAWWWNLLGWRNTHKGHYNFKADSLSLSMRAKGRKGENGPCASSPVTRVSHAFRASLYVKNEAPEEEVDLEGYERNDMVVLWRGYLKKGEFTLVHIEYRKRASCLGNKYNMTLAFRLTHLCLFPPVPHVSVVPDNATSRQKQQQANAGINGVPEQRRVGVK